MSALLVVLFLGAAAFAIASMAITGRHYAAAVLALASQLDASARPARKSAGRGKHARPLQRSAHQRRTAAPALPRREGALARVKIKPALRVHRRQYGFALVEHPHWLVSE